MNSNQRLWVTICYYIAFIGLGLTVSSLGPTLPALAAQTNSSLKLISYLFTARSLGYLLGSFQGGRLFDRLKGHPLIAVAIMAIAVCMCLVPAISALWLMIVVLLAIGFGESILDVGGNTLIVWLHGKKVGPFMNALHFFYGIGAFVSPIIIAKAIQYTGDINWAYWGLASLVFPVGLVLLRLPSPPITHAVTKAKNNPVPKLFLILAVSYFILYTGAEVTAGGWLYTYALKMKLATETSAAYLTSLFWGALTLGRLLIIPLALKYPPRKILLPEIIGAFISAALMLIFPKAIWIGTIGLGLSLSCLFPQMLAFAGRRLAITGKMTSYFFIGASGGAMLLPWFVGQLFETVGPKIVLWVLAGDFALLILIFGLLLRISHDMHEKKTAPEIVNFPID